MLWVSHIGMQDVSKCIVLVCFGLGASKRFVLFQGVVHEQSLNPFERLVVPQAGRFRLARGRFIHWAIFRLALLIRWIVQVVWAFNSSIVFIRFLFYQLCCHVSRVLLRWHKLFSLLRPHFRFLAYLVCEAHLVFRKWQFLEKGFRSELVCLACLIIVQGSWGLIELVDLNINA